MADRVVERKETVREAPRETLVVHDNDQTDRSTNNGVIIAVVVVVLIVLALLFGRSLFNGGGSGGATPSVNTGVNSGQ